MTLTAPRYGRRQSRCRQAAGMRLSRQRGQHQNLGDGRCRLSEKWERSPDLDLFDAAASRYSWTEICLLRNADTKKPAACGLSCQQRRRRFACISEAKSIDGHARRADIGVTLFESRLIHRCRKNAQHVDSLRDNSSRQGAHRTHRGDHVNTHAHMTDERSCIADRRANRARSARSTTASRARRRGSRNAR